MSKNIKIVGAIGVIVIIIIVAIWYVSASKTPLLSTNVPAEGSINQVELDRAIASLKNAVNVADQVSGTTGTSFDFKAQSTYGHYANFGVVKYVNEVKGVGLVDEQSIIFIGKDNNEIAEVEPKTGQVVSFRRGTEYVGTAKTRTELGAVARAFLNEVYPNFSRVEPTLTFADNSKTGRPEGSNYFFTWNDLGYEKELPEGVEAERAPFIQVGITSSGFIFSYNNTVDLYTNALQEFTIKQ